MDNFDDLAHQVLGYYSYSGGYTPGGFISALINAWEKADQHNRGRLSIAFPTLARVIDVFQREDGPERLQGMLYEEVSEDA